MSGNGRAARGEPSRAVWEARFEAAPQGEALLDGHGRFVRVNAAFAALSGLPAGSHRGRRPAELGSSLGACLDGALRQAVTTGVPVIGREHTLLAPNGRTTHLVVNLHALRGPSAAPLGHALTVLDVSAIRGLVEVERAAVLAREEVARAMSLGARRALLARVAHELRTPLSSTLIWLHLLRVGGGRRHPGALAALEQSAQAQLRAMDELFRAEDDGPGPAEPNGARSSPEGAGKRLGAPSPGRRASATKLSGLDVLVVEDDDLARDGLALVFEEYGARVKTAASVAEALEELGRAWPDVLVSDISMPREDGYVLIRRVRELARVEGRELPAVALTGFTSHEAQARVLAAGFDAFVAKPVAAASLLSVVRGLCGRKP